MPMFSSQRKGPAMSTLDAPRGAPHRTKQAFVYRTLHDAISTCEIKPGERLVIDDLARRLQVSAIPVREAIQMLQAEGLVVSVPHTGVSVAPVTLESIQDRSEEHTSELQSRLHLVCRLLLEKKKKKKT